MPKITFLKPDGSVHVVEAELGTSVMAAAVANDVEGIIGECGGQCACATCHAYFDEEYQSLLREPAEFERDMLEYALHVKPQSRLSCQIVVTDEMDGMIIRLPEAQT